MSQDILSNFNADSREVTDAKIQAMRDAKLDTTQIEKQVAVLRQQDAAYKAQLKADSLAQQSAGKETYGYAHDTPINKWAGEALYAPEGEKSPGLLANMMAVSTILMYKSGILEGISKLDPPSETAGQVRYVQDINSGSTVGNEIYSMALNNSSGVSDADYNKYRSMKEEYDLLRHFEQYGGPENAAKEFLDLNMLSEREYTNNYEDKMTWTQNKLFKDGSVETMSWPSEEVTVNRLEMPLWAVPQSAVSTSVKAFSSLSKTGKLGQLIDKVNYGLPGVLNATTNALSGMTVDKAMGNAIQPVNVAIDALTGYLTTPLSGVKFMAEYSSLARNSVRAGGSFITAFGGSVIKEYSGGNNDLLNIIPKSTISGLLNTGGTYASYGLGKAFNSVNQLGKGLTEWAKTDLQSSIYVSLPTSFMAGAVDKLMGNKKKKNNSTDN